MVLKSFELKSPIASSAYIICLAQRLTKTDTLTSCICRRLNRLPGSLRCEYSWSFQVDQPASFSGGRKRPFLTERLSDNPPRAPLLLAQRCYFTACKACMEASIEGYSPCVEGRPASGVSLQSSAKNRSRYAELLLQTQQC